MGVVKDRDVEGDARGECSKRCGRRSRPAQEAGRWDVSGMAARGARSERVLKGETHYAQQCEGPLRVPARRSVRRFERGRTGSVQGRSSSVAGAASRMISRSSSGSQRSSLGSRQQPGAIRRFGDSHGGGACREAPQTTGRARPSPPPSPLASSLTVPRPRARVPGVRPIAGTGPGTSAGTYPGTLFARCVVNSPAAPIRVNGRAGTA